VPGIRVIDSHTGGEPTRLVLEGGPELGGGPLAERVVRFRDQFDAYRSAIVNEPRGSDSRCLSSPTAPIANSA
jgi:4-hydroxyproline epimerase